MALPQTPALTTDCVIFDPVGRVLLIRRKHEPSAGRHALPGGFVKIGETVEAACRREVREEAGVEVSEPDRMRRAPNGWTRAKLRLASTTRVSWPTPRRKS